MIVISVANQKGGVGKTTTTVSLAAELADAGYRVLVIDFDPQASATSGLGVQRILDGLDLYDVFFGRVALKDIISSTGIEKLHIVPASRDLVSVELELGKAPARELILKTELAALKNVYDIVLIDCPPSSGLLSLNALGASNFVLIPLQAEYYALEGLSQLVETIDFVKATFNPGLDLLGLFVTMYDSRTSLSSQVETEARNVFAEKVFNSRIPRSVKLSESPSHALPINRYAPGTPGAVAYHELSKEILDKMFHVEQRTL